MGRRRHLLPSVLPSRPVPTTRTAWADEVLAAAAMDPRPEPCPAAVAARGWSVSPSFFGSLQALGTEDAQRLAEVWDEPAEMPGEVGWAAQYLAGQVHLGHLPPVEAVAVMVELVTRLGGKAVPVWLPDPDIVDASGHDPDYRGRCR